MSQNNESSYPLRFENAKPVPAEELVFAMHLGHAAAKQTMPTPNPSSKPIFAKDSEGSVTEYRLNDSLQMRGMVALNDHYHDDEATWFSIQVRLWAIAKLIRHPRMHDWELGDDVHAAVWVAAAELPVNRNGKFAVKPFFKRVKEIAAEHSAEELERKLLSHVA